MSCARKTSAKMSAEELKSQGNQLLKENHYEDAVQMYTEAIRLQPGNHILFSNRAQAQIKQENYGLAIADATESIKLDSNYLKAYYRRAVANFAILQYKASLADVKTILSKSPKDQLSLKLHSDVSKILRRIAFESAINVGEQPSMIEQLDLEHVRIEPSYQGPELPISVETGDGKQKFAVGMTQDYLKKMIEAFKEGGKIPKKHAFAIVACAAQIFEQQPTLTEIGLEKSNRPHEKIIEGCERINVCGDVHGQFFDVLNIFERFGNVAPKIAYLFNGDFVDRGSWSCEVALTFYALKILYPNHIYLNRGNHETNDMNKVYGFEDECKAKYNEKLFKLFSESFGFLPLATLIGGEWLVIHGGLFSRDDVTLDDIRNVSKKTTPSREGIEMELLWADPQPEFGRSPSKRGIGMQFGPDITRKFCDNNSIKGIIRSHEVRMGGYELEHEGRLITVFSAPNYCDSQGNMGAVIEMTYAATEYNLDFKTFSAVPHPDIRPMAYTSSPI